MAASRAKLRFSGLISVQLKLVCSETEPGIMEIALSRQPLFFRETNPQPRKHTLWQATPDFTAGQASMHRRHFLQCAPGMMNKHVEKLVHCNPRLRSLRQQTDVTLENPYFESRCSIFEHREDVKCQDFELNKDEDDHFGPVRFREPLLPHPALGRIDAEGRLEAGTSDGFPRHFPDSVTGNQAIKQDGASGEPQTNISWNGFKLSGIRRSMSKSELANHIGNQMYRQMYPGNQPAVDGSEGTSSKALDDITRYLLSDSQIVESIDGSTGKVTFDELTRQLLLMRGCSCQG